MRDLNPLSLGQAREINVQNLAELKQIMNTELKLDQYSSYSELSVVNKVLSYSINLSISIGQHIDDIFAKLL